MKERIAKLLRKFKELNPDSEKPIVVAGPGRVNIIGEHVDYNNGLVLPSAVDREILIAASQRKDNILNLYSQDYKERFEVDLDNLVFNDQKKWANYIMGVYSMLKEAGIKLSGANIVFGGNIPQGGGMSSSAALEVGICYTARLLNGFKLDDIELVKLCQKAENKFVGVMCGIMDQFASAMSKSGNLLLIDCENLSYKLVPADFTGVKIVLADTKKERTLAGSEYNLRRQQCNEAVKVLKSFMPKIKSLRDVSLEEYEKYKNKLKFPMDLRAKHVIYEIDRVKKAIEALKVKDMDKLGDLIYESHYSLKDNYEVSCLELDIMVEIASSVKGVFGSRMMGGGFGGCTITLVKEENVDELQKKLMSEYQIKTGKTPEIWVCNLSDGVRQVSSK